jgi:hypothetical protein
MLIFQRIGRQMRITCCDKTCLVWKEFAFEECRVSSWLIIIDSSPRFLVYSVDISRYRGQYHSYRIATIWE